MSESAVVTAVLVVLAVLIGGWVVYRAALLLMAYALFVMELHVVLVVLLFILFPPALLAFLGGYALLKVRSA